MQKTTNRYWPDPTGLSYCVLLIAGQLRLKILSVGVGLVLVLVVVPVEKVVLVEEVMLVEEVALVGVGVLLSLALVLPTTPPTTAAGTLTRVTATNTRRAVFRCRPQ